MHGHEAAPGGDEIARWFRWETAAQLVLVANVPFVLSPRA